MKIPKSNIYHLMKSKAGLPPGTLIHSFAQNTSETSVRLISFNNDDYLDSYISDPELLLASIKPEYTNWIQFTGLSDIASLETIGTLLQINPLIIEDILNTEHMPKSEEVDGQLFFVIKIIGQNSMTDVFEVNHAAFVLSKNFIISFLQKDTRLFDPFIERIRQAYGKIRQRSNDYILYRLIDIIVDNYYLLFYQTDEKLQEIEEVLMTNQSADMTREIQIQKKELNFIRRHLLPVGEALRVLMKNETQLIKKQHLTYFKDAADHVNHLTNGTDNFREMVNGLMELQMMNNSNRMNNVMKSLTIIATIFIPLTFIAGIYGMNFEYMPELRYRFAYPALLLIMIILGAGMYLFMRRKKWF